MSLWHKCGWTKQGDRAYRLPSKCRLNMLILENVYLWTLRLPYRPSESSCFSRWIFSIQLFKVTVCYNVQLHLRPSFHNHHGHKREDMIEMDIDPIFPSGSNICQRFMPVSLEKPRKSTMSVHAEAKESEMRPWARERSWFPSSTRRRLSLWSWLEALDHCPLVLNLRPALLLPSAAIQS